MKAIWSIVGILVIAIIIYYVYNKGKQTGTLPAITIPKPAPVATPAAPVNTNTVITERVPVFVPVAVNSWSDCQSSAYQNNLAMLRDDFLNKQAAYNNEINTSGPNAIALHAAMNVAYNLYLNEKQKCVVLI